MRVGVTDMPPRIYGNRGYYVPRTKAELIERLMRMRPTWRVSHLRAMTVHQLRAVWYETVRRVRGGHMPGEGGTQ